MEPIRRRPWLFASGITLVSCIAMCALAMFVTDAQAAQKSSAAPPAQPVDNRAVAEKALEAGILALEAGKTPEAVQLLSKAVQAGGLPSQEMAKALYHRGVGYRKMNQTAPAIADLTSALWLKGGLSEAERVDALNNRALAYREAGLSDRADADIRRSEAKGPAPQVSSWKNDAPQSSAAATPAEAPQGGIAGFFGNLFGAKASAPAAAKPAAPAAALSPSQSAPWQTSVSSAATISKEP